MFLEAPRASITKNYFSFAACLLGKDTYQAGGAVSIVDAGEIFAVGIEGEKVALSDDGKLVGLACACLNRGTDAAEQFNQRVALIGETIAAIGCDREEVVIGAERI